MAGDVTESPDDSPEAFLRWCLRRALAELDRGGEDLAHDSIVSDLAKYRGSNLARIHTGYDIPALMRAFAVGRPAVVSLARQMGLGEL